MAGSRSAITPSRSRRSSLVWSIFGTSSSAQRRSHSAMVRRMSRMTRGLETVVIMSFFSSYVVVVQSALSAWLGPTPMRAR